MVRERSERGRSPRKRAAAAGAAEVAQQAGG